MKILGGHVEEDYKLGGLTSHGGSVVQGKNPFFSFSFGVCVVRRDSKHPFPGLMCRCFRGREQERISCTHHHAHGNKILFVCSSTVHRRKRTTAFEKTTPLKTVGGEIYNSHASKTVKFSSFTYIIPCRGFDKLL